MIDFTDKTFSPTIETGYAFVKFYAPWCPHCQRLEPVWEQLADTFEHDESVAIGRVRSFVHRAENQAGPDPLSP